MKTKILNYCIKVVQKNYPDYDNDKIEIIRYGLEGIYLTFTKIVVLFTLSLVLGKFKKLLLLLLFYNVIRFSAFGLHAKKSLQCLIMSTVLFIGGIYLCDYISIPLLLKSFLCVVCILLIARYAPADTEKRPLINRKKRQRFKVISLLSAMIFSILIILFTDSYISNYLLVGMIEATLMILPISYRLFNLSYDNYKSYEFNFN